MENLPFIMGAQYYRAPTPGPEAWEQDLDRMRELGCNAVKYWVQWRWSSREPGAYYFDDLDRLMDLASERDLRVTLNVIFDVAPLWLYEKYPDAKQIRADGTIVEPRAVASRQIGGYPGPCLLHPGAREARGEFLTATVQHFKNHPAMDMWDIWNEAKLGLPRGQTRTHERLLCYCQHCRKNFIKWLVEKYNNDLQKLNAVWGRCYGDWAQVEMPLGCNAIADFVDYREFQIETLAGEAQWRIDLAHKLDPARTAYLHVVPSTGEAWDAVVCAADDFALAEPCDIFAATVNHQPFSMAQVLSAARGKTVYNVESHVNHGLIVR
ncbi:MAG: beta-galactosidase, partial [Candidatus Sumerlaeota bacterium]